MSTIKNLSFSEDSNLTLPKVPVSYLKCTFTEAETKDTLKIPPGDFPFAASPVVFSTVISAAVLTSGEDVKDIVEVMLDLQDKSFDWLPGDTVGVIPKNCQKDVDFLTSVLGFKSADKSLVEVNVLTDAVKKKTLPPHIPKLASLQFILENCLEIHAIVKKMFIRALAEFTSETFEKRRLLELCSREGSKDYEKYFVDEQWTLIDLLTEFPSCKPHLSLLLEHLPRLQPRPYSIASSPLKNPKQLRIVFSVVNKKRRRGLCSGWLFSLLQNYLSIEGLLSKMEITQKKTIHVPVYLRKPSKFRLPEELDSHVIMIGPGTGSAPFLGFLEHLEERKKRNQAISKKTSLYYGCRYKERDYIYRKQLEEYAKAGILSNIFNSFSRDFELQLPKYVQNAIESRKEDFIEELIDDSSHMFICGDALNMVKDVENTVIMLISEVKGVSKEEASSLFKELEHKGFIYKDIWR